LADKVNDLANKVGKKLSTVDDSNMGRKKEHYLKLAAEK